MIEPIYDDKRRRTPHGVRELKHKSALWDLLRLSSHPARGA